jgi:hypothetical protein
MLVMSAHSYSEAFVFERILSLRIVRLFGVPRTFIELTQDG